MSGFAGKGRRDWTEGFALPTEQWRGAWLIVLNGEARDRTYRLGQRITTLGRLHSNHVQLIDSGVSRSHSQVVPVAGGYEIRDLNSTGGTWVDGHQVKELRLQNGATIRVGSVQLRYEADAVHPVDHGLSRKTVNRETRKTTEFLDTNRPIGSARGTMKDSLAVLAQISQILGHHAPRTDKLGAIGRALVAQLGADRVLFLAGSNEGWKLEAHVCRAGVSPEVRRLEPHRKLMSQCIATGLTARAYNVAGRAGMPRAALCVPVFGVRISGLIYADRLGPTADDFSDDDASFASQVANTMAAVHTP